ncbi:hypothetical protein CASFOL_006875 [Castilleja foliolosa]|uniref:Uncharacterized protein n=1 Tax=Castilleja foliolosa TaxID=1961234 RepID=A0ABD3E861_9LAMI
MKDLMNFCSGHKNGPNGLEEFSLTGHCPKIEMGSDRTQQPHVIELRANFQTNNNNQLKEEL